MTGLNPFQSPRSLEIARLGTLASLLRLHRYRRNGMGQSPSLSDVSHIERRRLTTILHWSSTVDVLHIQVGKTGRRRRGEALLAAPTPVSPRTPRPSRCGTPRYVRLGRNDWKRRGHNLATSNGWTRRQQP